MGLSRPSPGKPGRRVVRAIRPAPRPGTSAARTSTQVPRPVTRGITIRTKGGSPRIGPPKAAPGPGAPGLIGACGAERCDEFQSMAMGSQELSWLHRAGRAGHSTVRQRHVQVPSQGRSHQLHQPSHRQRPLHSPQWHGGRRCRRQGNGPATGCAGRHPRRGADPGVDFHPQG
ncbi:hypothetical protein D9M71_581600 [compost metagenome]